MSFSTVKHHEITSPYLNFNGRLSEGPTYNPSNNTLLWVDIIGGKIHRVVVDKEDSTHEEIAIPNEAIGVIYLVENHDDLIYVGAKSGIASFDFKTREFKYVIKYPESDSKLRSNDGNVDPLGRSIYAGLMGHFDVGPIKDGKLYKIDATTGAFQIVVPEVLIPNGINWSKDGKTLYWTSSLEHTIYKFDYDLESNQVSNKRPHIFIKDSYNDFESPEPDGFALTESNHIFTAVWGTNSVAHYDENGKLVEVFTLPAERISAVSFGGVNLDEIFVTSANLNLEDESKLGENPEDLGGSLFRFKVEGQKGVLRPKLKSLIKI
jgi:sugar lactone lactonase YvrE